MNRFDRNISSFRRNVSQQWLPNTELLAKAMGEQQKGLNDARSLQDVPINALQVDEPYADNLRKSIADKIDNLANTYKTEGVAAGARARNKTIREIRKMQLPGGEIYNLGQNVNAHAAYKKQLDDLYNKGQITSTKRDSLLKKSTESFAGSYDDQNQFSAFSGISAAIDVDLAGQADKLAKGWMSDKVNAGTYKIINGQYYNVQTKEYVDPNEVYESVYNQLKNNPANKAFLQQDAFLNNKTGTDADTYMNAQIEDAANFASQKAGFTKYNSRQIKNWAAEQEAEQANKYKLIDYEYNLGAGENDTRLYTVNSGMPELDIKDSQIKTGTTQKASVLASPTGGLGRTSTKDVYKEVPIEQFASSEEGKKKYPGLEQITRSFPRKNYSDGSVESNAEYNKRTKAFWDKKRDALSKASGTYTQYSTKQSDDRTANTIGKGSAFGNIIHKTIWVTKPGEAPIQKSIEQFMEMVDEDDPKEFIKKSRILGDVKANNPLVPSGEEGVYSNGEDTYAFIVENVNNQDAKAKKNIYTATAPLRDGTIEYSQQFEINGEVLRTRAMDNIGVDEADYPTEYKRTLHVIGENGMDLTETEGITIEMLDAINNRNNPFSPLKADKQGNIIISKQKKVIDDGTK